MLNENIAQIKNIKINRKTITILGSLIVVVIVCLALYQAQVKHVTIAKELVHVPTLVERIKKADNPENILIKQTLEYKIVYNQTNNLFSVLVYNEQHLESVKIKVADYFRVLKLDVSKLHISYSNNN